MAHILLTGIATLDIVNLVECYPPEDSETRAVGQRITPGGNALNASRVLAALGHRTDLCAALAGDTEGDRIVATLADSGVGTDACLRMPGRTPTSYIASSLATGSRTIVHHRDLPELSARHFDSLPLERFDWIHFEGRNIEETARMMAAARRRITDQPISLEVEKERPGIETLMGLADVLVFSRHFATARGFDDAAIFLCEMRPHAPHAILCCPWGEAGAWAQDHQGRACRSPAFPPERVIDTLGAGDTFNAGLIDGLVSGRTLPETLEQACRLAGRKVGMEGFERLVIQAPCVG